jgi:hypothetical protein
LLLPADLLRELRSIDRDSEFWSYFINIIILLTVPRFDLALEKKAGDSEGLQLEIFESSTSGTKDHDVTKEEVSE